MADEAKRLTGKDIVCVGYGAWDGLHGYLHHVMARLAEQNRVLYVEGAPPRPASCRCRVLCSAATAVTGWFRGVTRVSPNLHVLRLAGHCPGAAGPKAPGKHLLIQPVRHHLRRLGFNRPILWCAFPTGVHLAGRLDERLVVYQTLDDYGCVPGVRREAIRDLEDLLLKRADLVLAASGHLFRGVMQEHPNAYYMPVAVDVDHFASAESAGVPPDLAALPRPLLGYLGSLDPRKVDVDLLAHVATTYPKWSLCVIGPADERERAVLNLLVGGLKNVHVLGHKTYEELPAYYAALDAVLLPYRLDEHTRALFPPQFMEGMAAGKPIVATDLDAIEHYRLSRTLCRVARDRTEFVRFAEEVLAEPLNERDVALRREHARRYDIDQRMQDIETLVLHGLSRP